MDMLSRLQSALSDRYQIERELGRGGMSIVYLARDVRHGREVALKVLRPELAEAVGPERFLQEIKLISRLQHPHILPMYDSGTANGLLFFVMPHMAATESLRDRLSREKQLPVHDAVRITIEVADALDHAHAEGIIHRDIKPENILLSRSHALVADFGIARAVTEAAGERITERGLSLGTPAYMSPEQASGETELDDRTDIYSLGCVLYEMLSGELPFTGPTSQVVIARRFTQPAPDPRVLRPALPEAVASAVVKALSLVPADRFQTVGDLARALGAPLSGATGATSGSRKSRVPIITAGVTLFLLLGGYGVISQWQTLRAPGPGSASMQSVAVLPFENMSGDRENEYFSDGMTEELISAFTKVEGLRVASRTSSFAFKGRNADVRQIGDSLEVSSVLGGSVRKSGNTLRITVQLTKVADGFQLWSESYDRESKDVFAVQNEIARAVVEKLRGALGAGDGGGLVRPGTANVQAYDLFLQGRHFWNRRTEDGMKRAIEYFQRAIEKDSTYARAYAGLADVYAVSGFYDYSAPRNAYPLARSAATRALELDESLAEPHATLGAVLRDYDWDWAAAERKFRHAIQRDPRYATAHHWLASLLVGMGRFDEAAAELNRARQLEPFSLIINAAEGWQSSYARDYSRAIQQTQRTIVLDSTFALAHLWMGMAHEQLGDSARALASLERALSLSRGPSILGALGHFHARHGNRAEAARLSSELRTARQHVPSYEIALIETGLGNRDAAFEWLDRAYRQREHSMVFINVDPRLNPLRSDPRFQSLLDKMRLARQ